MRKTTVKFLVLAIVLISISLHGMSQYPFYKDGGRVSQQSGTRNGPALYDQFYPLAGGYQQSCLFTDPENEDMTNIAAEDFIVPAGSTWGVRYIDVAGAYLEWTGVPIDGFNIYFYNDNNGIPGAVIHSFENHTNFNAIPIVLEDAAAFRYQIMLPSVVNLPAGHYWMSVQAICDFNETLPWAWLTYQGSTVEYEYHWKNPNDGFGTGFTDWTPASNFAWANFNLSFALYANGQDNDLSMISIDSPNTSTTLTSSESIVVSIKNEGINTETGFQVSYSINGGTTVTESPAITLAPNEIAQYTFTTTANLSAPGVYSITATVTMAGDPIPANNSVTKTIYNLGTVYAMPSTGTQTITTCGATFTDSGGLEGNAGKNDNAVTTIYPANPGDRVRLTFLEFDASYGGFKVYDGTSTSAPLLGNWTGTNSPGVLTALNAEGALTISYKGTSWDDVSGWVAFISCVTPVGDDFAMLNLTSSLTTIFQDYTTILKANVQNLGALAQDKIVTFKANGNIIGTRNTGMLNTADTAWVNFAWTPTIPGNYTIEASVPEDQGPEPNNVKTLSTYVYPFDAFFEDFEGAAFPPENWISKSGWGRNSGGYSGQYCALGFSQAGFSDTLISPRINIGANAVLSFYAVSNMWWPGGVTVIFKEEGTDEWIFLQTPTLAPMQYSKCTVDMSAFAGLTGRLGFVSFVASPYSMTGQVRLDYIIGQNITIHYDDYDLKFKSFDGDRLYRLGEESEFTFTIRNTGLQTIPAAGYRVKLMVGGQSPLEVFSVPGQQIAFNEEKTYNLYYTFPEIGVYHMYAVVELDGDQNPANNTSNKLVLSGIPAQSTIQLTGQKTYTNEYPISMAHNYSLSESLYYGSDIGQEGVIFGITWDYKFVNDSPEFPIRVWAGLTDSTGVYNAWIPAGDLTLVYDGKLNLIDGDQTVYIPFSTPIYLNDLNKNVVIMVQKSATSTAINQGFYQRVATGWTTKHLTSYTTPFDPYNPTGGTTASGSVPYVRFIFNDHIGAAQGTVTEIDGTPIEGAAVTISQLNIVTTTDAGGTYEFPYIPAGTYPTTADKHGFAAVTHNLEITEGNTTTLDFVMGDQVMILITGIVTGVDNPGAGIENAEITLSGISSYSTYSEDDGSFVLENVYGNNTYQISILADGYAAYSAPIVVTDADIDLGEIVLNESMLIPFVVMAEPVPGSMEVTWSTPASSSQHVLVFDDGGHENGWAGETGEEVWLGNYIPFDEPATINGFDLYWAKFVPSTTSQPMRLDIFDAEYNLVVSSETFMSGMDQWIYVEVPNITLHGDHYAMVYWNGTPAQSSYLGWDATDVQTEYACYKYAGGDIAPLSYIVNEKGNFMIRPHVMSESKAPLAGRSLTGYDIRFGKLNDLSNAGTWPKLNQTTMNANVFNDTNWPPSTNDRYVYAVQAFYTTGESEFSFSNVINYVGVGVGTVETDNIAIYPNPATDYVTISNSNGAYALLFGMDGSLKRRMLVNGNEFRMNLNGIASGNYLLVIQLNDGIMQQKLIVK